MSSETMVIELQTVANIDYESSINKFLAGK